MKKLILILILSEVITNINAQNVKNDFLSLYEETNQPTTINTKYYSGEKNNQDAMKSPSKIAAYNPVFLLGKIAMYSYQNIISPQLYRDCPYEITCSNYCKIAIQNKGFFIGVFMGAERLLRCNKMSMLDVKQDQQNSETGKILDTH